MTGLTTFIKRQFNYLVPKHCLLCLAALQGASEHSICQPCLLDLPQLTQQCSRCALPLNTPIENINSDHLLCGECLSSDIYFTKTLCPCAYQPPFDVLINQIKHQANFTALPILNSLLIRRALAEYSSGQGNVLLDAPAPLNVIAPVPLHWQRQLQRGYNQAALIAKPLAKALEVPYQDQLITRFKATQAQQLLSRQQRLNNLKGTFRCSPKVSGLNIGLVDDVITTGATTLTISKHLIDAGAASVTLFALARTAKL